jgi:hypothetical protein
MAHQNTDAMISIGSRWWRFPGARIETDSWEAEWCSHGRMLLHDDTGNVVEGVELTEAEIEHATAFKDD